MKTTFSASVICMNPLSLLQDIKMCEENFIDSLHIDIMDGHNVPRFGIYPEILEEISSNSSFFCDLHLMVDDIEFTLDQFLPCSNVNFVSFHLDQNYGKLYNYIDLIKDYGVGVGLVVNLCSSIDYVSQLLDNYSFDSIMFMGIKPGILTQTHRAEIVATNLNILTERTRMPRIVQCDGGVNFNSLNSLSQAGVNNFICGSSTIFKGIKNSHSYEDRKRLFNTNAEKLLKIIPK